MTDPNDPFDAFPEVVPAGPASTDLPLGEPEEEVVYDTGSDAWWRAQAAGQRAATGQEAPAPPALPDPPAPTYVEPPALVEPTVLLPTPPEPSPLDEAWYPDEPVAGTEPEPTPEHEPEPAPIWAATPAEVGVEADPDTSYAEELPRERPEPPSTPVGPLQAVAGAGIAVLGVVLAIGALFVFNHQDDTGSPAVIVPTHLVTTTAPSVTAAPSSEPSSSTTSAPTATSVPSAAPVAAAPIVPVSVLNNSKIKGLAKTAAADFRAGGWPVPTEGNYRGGTISTTTVYYAEGQQASAQRFAKQFGIPRVAPRFAGLPTKGMTVVVTRDYR